MELKFCYNPFNNEFFIDSTSHSVQLYNKERQKSFDDYIRGIITDDYIYIRVYYPFDDINELSYSELLRKSALLINDNLENIKSLVKKHIEYLPDIKTNITNLDLEGILVNI